MSLWRPETLHVGISATALTSVRLVRGASVGASAIPISGGKVAVALTQALQAAPDARSVAIVIDDPLGHLFVIKRPQGLRGLTEFDALAAARFTTLFGQSAEAWQLIADPHLAGGVHLVCSLPKVLLTQIRAAARAEGVSVASITLNFVATVNRQLQHRHAALNGDGLFANVGGASTTIAQRVDGAWADVRVIANPSRLSTTSLEALLGRERLALGQVKQGIDWACGLRTDSAAEAPERPSFRWLDQAQWPGQTREWSHQYRLALAGAWQ